MAVDTRRFVKRKRLRKHLTCFNLILLLVLLQVVSLLLVGFHHLDSHQYMESSLESLLFDGLWPSLLSNPEEEEDDDLQEMEDLMIENAQQQLEQQLEQQQEDAKSPLLQGDPIDNYFAREHVRKPLPLVVGGSDGSGTRAFVDVLARLGVPMLVDDKSTMDIHAEKLFQKQGWPPFAKFALKYGHSSNYDIETFPADVQQDIEKEMQRLSSHLHQRYEKLKIKAENVSKATLITFGFKAPITMLLLPMIAKYLYPDGFKYLHVVRDGRDVALSGNQSPVTKFYNYSYPDAKERLQTYKSLAPVWAMQLWNDWNADLYEWEKEHVSPKFDYIVMRTEDLLNPESKFEALTLLADFVGSPRTPEELCCQSRRAVVDLGRSTETGKRRFGSDMMRDYFERKREFMNGLARSVGKQKMEDMTVLERFRAMKEFRKNRPQIMADHDREMKVNGVSNKMAGRLSNRQKLDPEERQARIEDIRKMIEDKRLGNIDKKIKSILGRRRLMADKTLLLERDHRHLDPGRWSDAFRENLRDRVQRRMEGHIPDLQERLGVPIGDGRGIPDKEAWREHLLERRKEWLQGYGHGDSHRLGGLWDHFELHNRRGAGGGGDVDVALGKLILKQLDALKVNVPKKNVTERYGKWSTMLESNPDLSRVMHREGERALKGFGYEPPQRFMDRVAIDFVCEESVVCPEDEEKND